LESPFFCHYNVDFFFFFLKKNKKVLKICGIFRHIFLCIFFKNMSLGSFQRRVRQRTDEGIAAARARMENRQVIPERNVLGVDIMMTPLDFIAEIIQANHWG